MVEIYFQHRLVINLLSICSSEGQIKSFIGSYILTVMINTESPAWKWPDCIYNPTSWAPNLMSGENYRSIVYIFDECWDEYFKNVFCYIFC